MLRKKAAVLNSMVCGRSLGEMAGQQFTLFPYSPVAKAYI